MSEEQDKYIPPTPEAGDTKHAVAKAVISAVPWIGGPAAEVFDMILTPPISKRREEWMETVADGLRELEHKVEGFNTEGLSENDSFVTTLLDASQMAIRNHQQEKLDALKNAVLNASLPNPPEDDLQLMFLGFADTFTAWHLRILKFFEDPRRWGEQNGVVYPNWSMGGPSSVLEHAFPALQGKREFYDQIVKDLYARGLMTLDSLHTTMTANGMFASRTSDTGNRFLAFITEPRVI